MMEQYAGGSRQINNVNYGTTYRAPIQRSEGGYQRPQINIDIEGAVRAATVGISQGITKSQEQTLKQGYNSYASEINTTVQGLRQGAYSVEDAGNRIRAIDDRYISQGFDPLELAKIRSKFDGGVYSSVEAVQKKYEEAEAQAQIDFCKTMRERYPYMSDWTNQRILDYNKQISGMYDNIEYLTKQIGMLDEGDPYRNNIIQKRDELLESYGIKNTLSDLNEWLYNNADEPITPQKLHEVTTSLANEMVRNNKVDSRTAQVIADRIVEKSGLKALSDVDITNKKEVLEYNNLLIEGRRADAQEELERTVPQIMALGVLQKVSPEIIQAIGNTKYGESAFEIIGKVFLGDTNTITKTAKDTQNVVVSLLAAGARGLNPNNRAFKNTMTYLSSVGKDTVDDIINPTKETNVDIQEQNAETIRGVINSQLNKADNDTKTNEELLNSMAALNMVKSYVDSGLKDEGVKLHDLFQNLVATARQAGIRMDDNGMLVMLKEHPKYGVTNAFSDTQKYARQLNEVLAPMTPEDRKRAINEYLGDSIYQYDKSRDGELKDISEKSIGENVEDALVNTPGVIKDFIKDISKDAAKRELASTVSLSSDFDNLSDNEKEAIAYRLITDVLDRYAKKDNSVLQKGPEKYTLPRKQFYTNNLDEIRKIQEGSVENLQEDSANDKGIFGSVIDSIIPSANAKEFMSTSEYNARAAEIENARASGELTDDKQFQEAFDRLAKEFEGDRKEAVKKNPELLFTKVKELRKFFDEMQKAKKENSEQTPQTNTQIAEGRIKYASDTFGLPANIINAIFTVESNNGKDLESHTGVEGEMQITKATFKENCKAAGWTMADFYNPQAQVDVGTYYFKKQMDKFGNDIEKAAAAYNGGPTTIKRAIAAAKKAGKGTWKDYLEQSIEGTAAHKKSKAKEIRNHVKKIMKYVEIYKDKQYV